MNKISMPVLYTNSILNYADIKSRKIVYKAYFLSMVAYGIHFRSKYISLMVAQFILDVFTDSRKFMNSLL